MMYVYFINLLTNELLHYITVAPVVNETFTAWEDDCGWSKRIKMITCVRDLVDLEPLHQSFCPGVSFYNETDSDHTGVICYSKNNLSLALWLIHYLSFIQLQLSGTVKGPRAVLFHFICDIFYFFVPGWNRLSVGVKIELVEEFSYRKSSYWLLITISWILSVRQRALDN